MVHGPASDDPGGDPHEHVDYPGGIRSSARSVRNPVRPISEANEAMGTLMLREAAGQLVLAQIRAPQWSHCTVINARSTPCHAAYDDGHPLQTFEFFFEEALQTFDGRLLFRPASTASCAGPRDH